MPTKKILIPFLLHIGLQLVILILLVSADGAKASTVGDVDKTCPLCKFKFTTTVAFSGFQADNRLDLKPLGAIAAPWPLPVCPSCHFVLFKDELTSKEKTLFASYVNSKKYKTYARKRASYVLLAKLYEQSQRSDLDAANAWLRASWEEEPNRAQYEEDLNASLRHFKKYLSAKDAREKDKEQWQTAEIVSGEIERLLADFEAAKTRFARLSDMPEFQDNFQKQLIAFELQLAAKKDSTHHTVSEVQKIQK